MNERLWKKTLQIIFPHRSSVAFQQWPAAVLIRKQNSIYNEDRSDAQKRGRKQAGTEN